MRTSILSFLLVAATATAARDPVAAALKKAASLEGKLNYPAVIEVLLPHADSGDGEVEFGLANAYLHVAADGRRPEEIGAAAVQPAIDWAERAAAHGNAAALNLLYVIYGNGVGVAVDGGRAVDYLVRAVDAGDLGAKLNYAVSLYRGTADVRRDVDKACGYLFELLGEERVQALAAYWVGLVTFKGECGREADREAGMTLIAIAAEHGMREAESDMGKGSEFGWAGPADRRAALEWYEKAAAHGEPYALWRIGMAYVEGEFRDADSAKAVQYFEQAAAAGSTNGMTSLAVMYATGDGVPQDASKARQLYEEAASGGNSHAYRELALMYLNGEGVAVDLVRARFDYARALALGEPEEPPLLRAIESRMTAEELERAERLIEAAGGP